MDTSLATTYILILIVLLAVASFFVIRQVVRTRRVERTLAQLQQAVTSGEATSQTHYELGSLFLTKKMFTQAVGCLKRALKTKEDLDPENLALIHNALGYSYVAKDQIDLAIRHYKDALDLVPNYTIAWNNLGFAYEKKKLVEPAIAAYAKTLELDSTNRTALRRSEALKKRLTSA